MTTIGYATLQIIPSLRGVKQRIEREAAGLELNVDVDATGGRAAGRRAGRDIRQGIDESRFADGLHRHVDTDLSSGNAQRSGRRFGAELAGAITVGMRGAARGTGILARDVGRVTASLVALLAVGRGLSMLSSFGKFAAAGSLGLAALMGAAAGVTSMIGGPLVAALKSAAAAMGVAAAAATGILAPALVTLGLGIKGMQDAVKAYTAWDKSAAQGKAAAAAARQVSEAERGVERAKKDSLDAEQDLTRARKAAMQQLEDMNLELRGAALTERDAQLSLLEARRDLENLGKDGQLFDMIDRERAILGVQEAEQRLAETQGRNRDLSEKAAEANRAGVEGAENVVAAKQRIADLDQAAVDAEQRLADARQAAAAAQTAGQDPFDLSIGQRMAPALDAVKGLQRSITDSLTTALVPAFVTFGALVGSIKPKLAELAGMFGSIGSTVMKAFAGPEARAGFDGMIAGAKKFFAVFNGEGGGGLGKLATGLTSFLGTAAATFAGFGATVSDALGTIGDRLGRITPEKMIVAFTEFRAVLAGIRGFVGPIVAAFTTLAGISAPALAPGFAAIGGAIKDAMPGLTAMTGTLMPALGVALENLAPILPGIVSAMQPWSVIVAAIVPPLASLVAYLGPLSPLIFGVALAAKGIGVALVAWNAAAAVASVAQGVFAAATGASASALGTNTIALAAHRVALIAGSAATGIVTGAQWLLNAALNANPIGIVVLALAGLAAGLVYAYNHSETFRNIVQAAWSGIKAAAGTAWTWISTVLWPGMKAVFSTIGAAAMWLWDKAIKPAWNGIRVGIGIAWDGVKVIFDLWVGAWRRIGEGATWLWDKAIKPAWELIQAGFSSAWNFVSGIFDKITGGWDKLKTGITGTADAIKAALHGAFSGLADVLKAPLKMLGTFLSGIPTEVLGITVPGAATLNTWGDTLKGLSAGGYTGNLPVGRVAGVVHGDEHVIRSSSRRSIENAYPGLLDYLNNHGALPGYQDGGWVDATGAKRFAESMKGTPYVMGGFAPGAVDCSGFVSAVANVATGRPPFSSRMSTVTEGAWLKSMGFQMGTGGPGDLRVGWWDKGGGPNGHTAGTLPDGTNFESNGSQGVVIGGKTGADSGQFTSHAFLPSAATPAAAPTGIGGAGGFTFSAPAAAPMPGTSASKASASLPDSFSGLAGVFGDHIGQFAPTVSPDGTTESLSKVGAAAGQAAAGQVSSALSVFGINDSPGWLKGISQLVGGISIGGSGGGGGPLAAGGGAAPLSAASSLANSAGSAATGLLGSVHGGQQAGQAPGPTNVWNIQAGNTADALKQAETLQNERRLAQLAGR